MTGIYSGQCAQVRQDFGMNRLESSGSDYSMGMSFMGKGVNPSYTPHIERPVIAVYGASSGNEGSIRQALGLV